MYLEDKKQLDKNMKFNFNDDGRFRTAFFFRSRFRFYKYVSNFQLLVVVLP